VNRELREKARAIFEAGLAAADPAEQVEGIAMPVPGAGGRLMVLGAGKAAAHLAKAVESRLDGRDYSGRIVVKYGHGVPLERVVVEEGGHPLPDASGLRATERLLADLDRTQAEDRIVFLLTGGASALLVAPAEGLTLDDKIGVTEVLLRSGATIQELNAVRKHLSAVKGGRLLERMVPARVLTLVVSDVIGDDLSSIGSGPTALDPSTFRDALDVLTRYDVIGKAPASVVDHLRRGVSGAVAETPKPGDSVLDHVEHRLLASNRTSLAAAAEKARALGFEVGVFAQDMVGDVHVQAQRFAKALLERRGPAALIAGGELTLEVTGSGLGGRSQEFALVVARELAGRDDVIVLAAGTDGTDGPTDAAGAFADGRTWERAREHGLDPEALLANNDAYRVFDPLDGLLRTGPTGTNVNDLVVGLLS
jgi:hydroxypyruvate reductase